MAKQHLVKLSREAEEDSREASNWYQSQAAGLSNRFLSELEKAFKKIALRPRSFLIYNRNKQVRRCSLKRFPYNIFYHIDGRTIKIISIIHQSRSVRFVKRRLK